MISSQHKEIAIKWFEAFNTHDLEKLLSLYHQSAKHYSPKLKIRLPKTQGLICGKDELRNWWKDAFDRIPSLNYEVKKLTADNHQVFMEYIRHADGDEDLMVGEVLEIENGLIVFSRVYHG